MKRIIVLTAFLLLGILSLHAADIVYVFKYKDIYDNNTKKDISGEATILVYSDNSVVVYGGDSQPFYYSFNFKLFGPSLYDTSFVFFSNDGDKDVRRKYAHVNLASNGAVAFYIDEQAGVTLTFNMKPRGDESNKPIFDTLISDYNNKTGRLFARYAAPVQKPAEPTASVDQIWLEHNKWYMGVLKGMEVHVKFQTFNQRGILGVCNALFYLSDGRQIMDTNFQYRSLYGQVVASDSFIPQYDNTTFNDFVIFMPYTELHLSGHWDCMVQVEVVIGGQTAKSDFAYFTYN